MDSRPTVRLPPDLVELCDKYGADLVAHYARGGSPNSAAVSSRGAERNTQLQSMAKQAECVFCQEYGLGPLDLRWDCTVPDKGWDVVYGRARVDVKYTERGRRLIWPANKASFIMSKNFDALVLVKMTGRGEGFTVGWIGKTNFIAHCLTAVEGDETRLDAGTLYVDQDALRQVPQLTAG